MSKLQKVIVIGLVIGMFVTGTAESCDVNGRPTHGMGGRLTLSK